MDPANDSEDADPPQGSFERFSELKKEQRRALLALPPDEAQASVECILHARLWRVENPEQLAWPGDWADEEDDA